MRKASYEGVLAVDWAEHMPPSSSLAVELSASGSGIDNTHFGALKVKDAIVDKLCTPSGERPNVEKLNPDLRIHLRLDGEAVLARPLRPQPAPARLPSAAGRRTAQGNLAAAILLRAGWPKLPPKAQRWPTRCAGSAPSWWKPA